MIWRDRSSVGSQRATSPTITLRIPGDWRSFTELKGRLSRAISIDGERLRLQDGFTASIYLLPKDRQFSSVFRAASSRPIDGREFRAVKRARQFVIVQAPAGNKESAQRMIDVGANIIESGGLGVFLDSGARAHSADSWREAAKSYDDPAVLAWTYATIVRGKSCLFSTGMHVLGQRDVQLRPTDSLEDDFFDLTGFLVYLTQATRNVEDGHFVGASDGRYMYEVRAVADHRVEARHPMHNRFGIWDMQPLSNRCSTMSTITVRPPTEA